MDILTIETKVKEIIADTLHIEIEKIAIGSKFMDDLGADSLDAMEIMLCLQDEFGVVILEKDVRKIVSVEDAVSYLRNRLLT